MAPAMPPPITMTVDLAVLAEGVDVVGLGVAAAGFWAVDFLSSSAQIRGEVAASRMPLLCAMKLRLSMVMLLRWVGLALG